MCGSWAGKKNKSWLLSWIGKISGLLLGTGRGKMKKILMLNYGLPDTANYYSVSRDKIYEIKEIIENK